MSFIILGIDPGTVNTGYGLVHVTESQVKCLDYGIISAGQGAFGSRIHTIHKGIKKLCKTHRPDHLAIEKIFFGKNLDTAFKLGHIFALCLLESENYNMQFFEYASRTVKKAVTFSGKSSKELVRQFVVNFFSLPPGGPLDATDALAVALCHNREHKKNSCLQQLKVKAL